MTDRTVYKYPFPDKWDMELVLPVDAQPLHAAMQGDVLCLWILLNLETSLAGVTTRRFMVHGTGHRIQVPQERLKHISTVLDNAFVWHVFEVLPPAAEATPR